MNAFARSSILSLGMFKSIGAVTLAGFLLPLLSGCASPDASHAAEVDAWHRGRMEELRKPDGWLSLERHGRFAVRVKDSESSALAAFDGIERFPVSPDWRIEAQFEPYLPPRTIEIPTAMGTVSRQTTPGRVVFHVDGTTYSLDVTGEPGDEEYFVIFADETNGTETYPAGRYLWIDGSPGRDGGTVVDFNKSYNPPRVFTPYATCPFPPPQNRLGLRIDAGEKNYEAGIQMASID